VDTPLRSASHPLFPDTLLPVVSEISPDVPEDPTPDVLNDTDPDPDWVLDPLVNVMDPARVLDRVWPADSTTSPPKPLSLLPTTTLMEPDRPPVAKPDCITSQPLLPDLDVPVRSCK
jgi:hypothetical protein